MKEPAMVLESARRQLNELAPLAEQLNAASDVFTEELKTIESELKALGLGVDVTLLDRSLAEEWPVDYDEDEREPDQIVKYLAYGRDKGSWRILVRSFREWDDSSAGYVCRDRALQEEAPLIDASRELRIAAADLIEPLLSLLSTESKKKLDSLNKVIDKSALPAGWESLHLALADTDLIHVLKPDLKSGETLCGAKAITTNFNHEGKRPCSKCRSLALEITKKSGGTRRP